MIRYSFIAALAAIAILPTAGDISMAQDGNAAAKVEAVFAAVAKGDASDTDALLTFGDAIVPAVSTYLSSSDENVRTEAVALLAALETEVAAKALLPALTDASEGVRERAARAVLAQVLATGEFAGLGEAVAKGLAAGEPDAAILLLGAFSQGVEGRLRAAADSTSLVKLADSDLPVPASLPAQVALSALGDSLARSALDEAIARGDIAELLFLLDVLPLLDDTSTIVTLATKTLDDERPVAGGVPAGAEPSRRVADRAVEALVKRLKLKPSFDLDEAKRYSAAQIAEVRKSVVSAIPI